MGKTIVAFSATPRKRGNSDLLADCVLEGVREAGAAAEKVRLRKLDIHPCIACNACKKSPDAPCALQDDMAPLLDKVRAADGIVFAAPIYFFSMNAQMKTFLDRLYALFGADTFDALKGKKAAVVLTYGDSDPLNSGVMNALRTFQDAFTFLDVGFAGCVHASCDAPGEVASQQAVLDQAKALGRKLAVSLH